MSAPQIPIPVTRMQIAPTVMVLSAVLAKRVSLEMGQLVKVFKLEFFFRPCCL